MFGIEFGLGEGFFKDIESNEIEERRYYVFFRCLISYICFFRVLLRFLVQVFVSVFVLNIVYFLLYYSCWDWGEYVIKVELNIRFFLGIWDLDFLLVGCFMGVEIQKLCRDYLFLRIKKKMRDGSL